MKVLRTFLSLVFAIYAGVRGIEFVQHESNAMILFGIGCLVFAVGYSYIAVSGALKKSS
jgi:1,4-dihydroxy-2-naphthoate octaprenyltransferase